MSISILEEPEVVRITYFHLFTKIQNKFRLQRTLLLNEIRYGYDMKGQLWCFRI